MRLQMKFESEATRKIWLKGLQDVYDVHAVGEPEKVAYLKSVFRLAHTDNPGLAEASSLPALEKYLNLHLPVVRVLL